MYKQIVSAVTSIVILYAIQYGLQLQITELLVTISIGVPVIFLWVNKVFDTVDPPAYSKRYPVSLVSVHDGDTLNLNFHGKVDAYRIRFIDTPELDQTGGEAAAAKLASLIHGKYLEIAFDESNMSSYKRSVCILYASGENVGLQMLRSGYAWIDTRFYVEKAYHDAFSEAVDNRRGIFKNVNSEGSNMPVHPREFVNNKKGTVDLTDALVNFTKKGNNIKVADPNRLS